tara:strand:- start:249 stop:359 length:111 start_codon:yes stop_codon:yes gene_type:complete
MEKRKLDKGKAIEQDMGTNYLKNIIKSVIKDKDESQ